MSKKLILVLLVVALFFFRLSFAFAGLTINEIMYDLSGSDSTNSKSREWVEVYNSGSIDVSIDASKWRLYDGGANRTINGEVDFIIPSSGYVIFSGDKDTFILDNPSFGGIVYDTGFTSFNNTGATLKILDQDGNIVDEVIYTSLQGGAGDGNSLQKISNLWSGSTPTPGIANETVVAPPSIPPTDTSSGSSSSSVYYSGGSISETKTKIFEIPKIKTQITVKTLGFVNLPLVFNAMTFGLSGEQLRYGKYFWNFGDGDSKEVNLINNQSFPHTYFYPGDYVVSLDYFSNPYIYYNTPDASNQIIIKIIGADISISRVGDEKDFFIELSNNTDYSIDLSNWFLVSTGKSFTIPRNTILVAKKKIIISSKITNFLIEDKYTLKLMNPEREVVFDYTPTQVAQEVSQGPSLRKTVVEPREVTPLISDEQISVENLGANVIQSDVVNNNSSNSYLPIFGSIIFIGVSASVVYFIRQKKVIREEVNDFEILDE